MNQTSHAGSPKIQKAGFFLAVQGVAALMLTLLAGMLGAPSDAFGATKSKSTATQSAAAGKKASNRVTYRPSPSEESRRDRERRLERECRNKPNAGACAGFGYGARR